MKITNRTVPIVFSMLAISCGGGGGGGSSEPTQHSDNGIDETSSLPGTLYYDNCWARGFVSFDFKSKSENLLLSQDKFYDRWVSISKDGSWLGSAVDAGNSFKVDNLKDISLSYVINYAPYKLKSHPVFSPDGGALLSEEEDNNGWYLTVRKKDGMVVRIPDEIFYGLTGKLFDGFTWVGNNSVAFASGTYLYYVENIESPQNATYRNLSPYYVSYLSSSPDGSKLAYVKSAGWDEPGDIFVVDADGSERQLTTYSDARSLVWSPDGKYIAFVSGHWHGGADIGGNIIPPLHVIPSNLDAPVVVVSGKEPESTQVMTVKFNNNGEPKDVCVDGTRMFWNP